MGVSNPHYRRCNHKAMFNAPCWSVVSLLPRGIFTPRRPGPHPRLVPRPALCRASGGFGNFSARNGRGAALGERHRPELSPRAVAAPAPGRRWRKGVDWRSRPPRRRSAPPLFDPWPARRSRPPLCRWRQSAAAATRSAAAPVNPGRRRRCSSCRGEPPPGKERAGGEGERDMEREGLVQIYVCDFHGVYCKYWTYICFKCKI